ncbi:ABC transporter permease, partial [Nguyenibacter vanlangensis]|nr:ABC transporter permease [Nguyenibacter vanlangensis]
MRRALVPLVGRRFATAALSLVFVVVAVFAITSLLPGDATDSVLGQSATPQSVQALRHSLHLDRPAPLRF